MVLQAPPQDIVDTIRPTARTGEFHPCQAKGCSATRSYYFAIINGTEMSYCGHHATEYEVKLLAASQGNVRDLRHTILDTPEVD